MRATFQMTLEAKELWEGARLKTDDWIEDYQGVFVLILSYIWLMRNYGEAMIV